MVDTKWASEEPGIPLNWSWRDRHVVTFRDAVVADQATGDVIWHGERVHLFHNHDFEDLGWAMIGLTGSDTEVWLLSDWRWDDAASVVVKHHGRPVVLRVRATSSGAGAVSTRPFPVALPMKELTTSLRDDIHFDRLSCSVVVAEDGEVIDLVLGGRHGSYVRRRLEWHPIAGEPTRGSDEAARAFAARHNSEYYAGAFVWNVGLLGAKYYDDMKPDSVRLEEFAVPSQGMPRLRPVNRRFQMAIASALQALDHTAPAAFVFPDPDRPVLVARADDGGWRLEVHALSGGRDAPLSFRDTWHLRALGWFEHHPDSWVMPRDASTPRSSIARDIARALQVLGHEIPATAVTLSCPDHEVTNAFHFALSE